MTRAFLANPRVSRRIAGSLPSPYLLPAPFHHSLPPSLSLFSKLRKKISSVGGLMSDLQAEAYVDPRVVDLNRGKQVCSYFVQRLLTLIDIFCAEKSDNNSKNN